jgi:hypothetical protein
VIQPELLDTLEPEAGRANLADLVRLNRWWGGRSTLRRILDRAVPEASFSLLDVGAASGDMGAYVRQWRPRARVTSLDAVAWHLGRAAQPKLAGDGFALPFLESAFDYVFCSLFLHHFSDAQVVTLLSEFGRVARRAVLVIDLERHPLPYFFVGWTRWIFGWDRVTCHDAAVSVEAAFRPAELVRLARAAGLPNPQARAYRPAFRVGMIAGAAPAL